MRMEQHEILETFKKKFEVLWEELYHQLEEHDEKVEKEEVETEAKAKAELAE
jgi:hypothetical protein